MAAFARDWKAARQQEQKTCGGVFVPLAFLPGEAFQFDWSEDWAIIAGERTKLQVAHVKLSYSRAFILRAYPQQTHEMPTTTPSAYGGACCGGVLPRKAIRWGRRLECTNLSGLWRDNCAPLALMGSPLLLAS